MSVALVVTPMVTNAPDDGCPDRHVRDSTGDCTVVDELVVLTNGGESRAEVEAAVAPFRGVIVQAVEIAGAYLVRFPVARLEDLSPIRQALLAAGFTVGYSRSANNFASR